MKKIFKLRKAWLLILCLVLATGFQVCTALADSENPYTVLNNTLEDTNNADYDGYIVKLNDDAPSSLMSTLDVSADDSLQEIEYMDDCYKADSIEDIKDSVSAKYIDYIEPDYYRYLDDDETASVSAPNDTNYANNQWNLKALNVPQIWNYGIEGQDFDATKDLNYDATNDNDPIVIAVIDSGLKTGHEDIDWNRILTGKNFVDTSSSSTDDTLGHGTFCTGIIMAAKNNNQGIAGICQNVYVMPLKVFEGRTVEDSVVISAIEYAAEQKTKFDNTKGASGTDITVINMSLGGENSSLSLQSACEDALNAGIIVVCAAGNDGNTTASYPAQYTMGVGSTGNYESAYPSSGTDAQKSAWETAVSSFSQRLSSANGSGYAKKVWICAPGASITSTYCTNTSSYSTGSGTSFACPEVSALAAIAKGINNNLTQDNFMLMLKDTATAKTSGEGKINGQDIAYGWGIVNYTTFINQMIADVPDSVTLTIAPQKTNGTAISDATCNLYQIATDTNGNEIKGTAVTANENGTFTVQKATRYIYSISGNKYETATGTVSLLSAAKTLKVPLTEHVFNYQVTTTPTTAAAGVLTGTCSCGATDTIALPALNTTDYSYEVVTPATVTTTGVGKYTWNNTDYGNFSFTQTIPYVDGYMANLSTNATEAGAGNTFTVSVIIDSNTLTAFNNVSGKITYDTTRVQYVNADTAITETTPGELSFNTNSANSNAIGNTGTTVATLTFKVLDSITIGSQSNAAFGINNVTVTNTSSPDYTAVCGENQTVVVYNLPVTLPTAAANITGVTNNQANRNQDITFTLPNLVAGNKVILTIGTANTELTANSGVYTIPAAQITGAVTVNVTTVNGTLASVDIDKYNALPTGYKIITYVPDQTIEGVKYQYNGNDMIYSATYQAYLYFVPDTVSNLQALLNITATNGTAPVVSYDGDVNNNNTNNNAVNIDDAVLVFDLYSNWSDYLNDSDFTKVSMLNRLEADVNGDGTVDIKDTRAVITMLLNANNAA